MLYRTGARAAKPRAPVLRTSSRRVFPKSYTGIEAVKSAARLPTVRAPIAAAGSVVCGYVYPAPAAIGVFRGASP